jgi:oligopeptidase B
MSAEEEVLIDENLLAKGHDFFDLGGLVVSEDQTLIAYAVDTVGRRFHTIRFMNLNTRKLLPDTIPNVTASMIWANDDKTLFYVKQDPVTLRWHQVYRHVLGTDPARDVLVFEESDDTFSCWLYKTKSRRFVVIESQQTLSTEARFLDADDPAEPCRVFLPREKEHEYRVDHDGEHFYIRTNWNAKNFRLMKAQEAGMPKERWEELVGHRENVLFEGFELFRDQVVLEERHEGLVRLRVRPNSGVGEHYVAFDEPAYLAWIGTNFELCLLYIEPI